MPPGIKKSVWQNVTIPGLKLHSSHYSKAEERKWRDGDRHDRFLCKVTRLFKGRPTDLAGDKQLLELPC